MKIPQIGLLLTLCAGALIGCKNSEGSDPMQRRVPADFSVIFGQQGIVAGQGMGYSIYRDGQVVRWQGKHPEETRQARATLDPAAVEALWKRVQEIGFLEMSEQAMATTNTFITVTAGGESRRVTWVERDDAPTPAQTFYDECVEIAKAALQTERG